MFQDQPYSRGHILLPRQSRIGYPTVRKTHCALMVVSAASVVTVMGLKNKMSGSNMSRRDIMSVARTEFGSEPEEIRRSAPRQSRAWLVIAALKDLRFTRHNLPLWDFATPTKQGGRRLIDTLPAGIGEQRNPPDHGKLSCRCRLPVT